MINRTEIFKNAWTMVKNFGMTLSAALKAAWAKAKEVKCTTKDWFDATLAREINRGNHFYASAFCLIKETEKAAYIMFNTGAVDGHFTRKCLWVPKSAIENLHALPVIADYNKAVSAFTLETSLYI